MMNHIGISCRHMMNPHYLCLSHHLSCQGDMPMVEKTLAKNYKVSPELPSFLSLALFLTSGYVYNQARCI